MLLPELVDDCLEADLLAARRLPFSGDRAAWVDAYLGACSRLVPTLSPALALAAATRAWRSHGWAHPAVVAHLEHELGPLAAD